MNEMEAPHRTVEQLLSQRQEADVQVILTGYVRSIHTIGSILALRLSDESGEIEVWAQPEVFSEPSGAEQVRRGTHLRVLGRVSSFMHPTIVLLAELITDA